MPTSKHPLLLLLLISLVHLSCDSKQELQTSDWAYFGGDQSNSQYSTLDQITPENVDQLEVAWTYRTGDHNTTGSSQIQCNPLVIDGVLYGSSPQLKLFALDAASGKELWSFDPYEGDNVPSVFGVSRGLSYWKDGDDERLLFGAGMHLYAIDSKTGKEVDSFGNAGKVDLREGLGRDVTGLFWALNTPGVVHKDLYIIGGRVAEELPSAPGYVRAFNVRTGELAWTFRTVPQPGEVGYETWPKDAWNRIGGANPWTGMALDAEREIVYVPTGSAAFDFWGGNRHGDNLFANSLIALNANTGERIWHFQAVKHDLWDRDFPAAPNLLTVNHNGVEIDAVAQISKSGHIYLFDRVTGEALFPMEEFDVPPSRLDGELAATSQVLPTKPLPFSRQEFTAEDVNPNSVDRALIVDSLAKLLPSGQFVPPSEEGTIIFPGFDGGGEWGGAAHDPNSGIIYVNGNEMPWVQVMRKLDVEEIQKSFTAGQQVYYFNCASCHGFGGEGASGFPSLLDLKDRKTKEETEAVIRNGGGRMPSFPNLNDGEVNALVAYLYGEKEEGADVRTPEAAVLYNHMGYNRWLDSEGYPAIKPPWGTLNAIDLNTGDYLWTVPLGEFVELSEKGIPQTGTENYGGPVLTGGGLLFIGGSKDEYFRAFDKDTGAELFKSKLPAGGYATPATYEVGGKQYVVIAAGGGKMGTKSGDYYVAYALP